MKKKFQFLRRRNTDTAIGGECHSSSVFRRPTPDQVQKWSRSFDSLLNDKGMCPYRSIPEYQLDGHFEKSEKSHYFNKYLIVLKTLLRFVLWIFFQVVQSYSGDFYDQSSARRIQSSGLRVRNTNSVRTLKCFPHKAKRYTATLQLCKLRKRYAGVQ